MRGLFIAAIILGATFGAAHARQPEYLRPYWVDRPAIEAIGRVVLEVPADTATFGVTYEEVARDADQAAIAVAERARRALDAIRARAGQNARIETSTEIEALHEQYRDAQGVRREDARADQIVSYAARAQLTIELTSVDQVQSARAAAIALNPSSITATTFSLADQRQTTRRAYSAAVAEAAARARAAAEAASVRLGQLMAVQEGQGPCLGRWVGAPVRDREASIQSAQNTRRFAEGYGDEDLGALERAIARLDLPSDPPPIRIESAVCAVYAIAP